jgi:CubicO group peptidase (beta-lactamase class C family)
MKRTLAMAILLSTTPLSAVHAQDTTLVGLWQSKRWFGPEVRGELRITRSANLWRASIGSREAQVTTSRDSLYFDMPGAAKFKGQFVRNRSAIMGQWIETVRRVASPVLLSSCGSGCYSGIAQPYDDEFTFYMEVKPRPNGELGAFLRNPERNQGRFIGLDHLVRRGDTVYLRDKRDTTIEKGILRGGRLSVFLRGATHDFEKVPPDSFTYFYPRGYRTGSYTYTPPRAKNDGWTVARARDVGMSEDTLEAMVRMLVNSSVDSTNNYRLHGVLVARHGKLVLDEYFFGENAEKVHDTRSASKTLVSVVLGAAMQAGMKVSPQTQVFSTMGMSAASLEPRKQRMQLRHLLTMSSGLDCDDNAEEYHEGSEESLTNQDTIPDWLGVVKRLKMIREPGAKGVYCSINPYLAGNVIERATGKPFLSLAYDLVGAPLQMGRYYLTLDPVGNSYNGGGARFVLRDFAKLAQLYANGGTWNGRRILSPAWIRESIEPRYLMSAQTDTKYMAKAEANYGYLWWSSLYKYHGRIIRAYMASGNGGQFSMFIPDLDIVVATWGGNYADRGGLVSVTQLVPQYILPAIIK